MKKIGLFICLLFIAGLIAIPAGRVYADSPVIYEYYNTGKDTSTEAYLLNYFAQTFTTADAHTLESVRLMLYREGATIQTLYVDILETDGDGKPTGLAISSGELSTLAMTTSTTGAWYEIPMESVALEKATKYAIVIYSTGTTNLLNVHWMIDGSAGAYAGGSELVSTDGGISWTADTDDDYMFEVWGYESVEIMDVKVFQSYQSEGDWLVTISYNIQADCGMYEYPWEATLKETGGSDIASWRIVQCGYKPQGLYIGSTLAETLVWGGDYTVEITGLYGSNPNASIEIATADWVGGDLVWLDAWVIHTAGKMGEYDETLYTVDVPIYLRVLNVAGGTIFDAGIPYLSDYRPDIFLVSLSTLSIGYDDEVPVDYADSLEAQPLVDVLGAPLATAIDGISDWFGVTTNMMALIFLLIGFIAIAMIEKTIAVIVILGGVVLGIVPMAALFIVVFVLSIVFIRGFFWSST